MTAAPVSHRSSVASPSLGVAVQQQLEQDGSAAKVVTCAFNGNLLPLLQNGKVAFTIDQQPYLQGYLSIDSLWLYKKNKSVIGAQQSIPTGPVVVDHSKHRRHPQRREVRPADRHRATPALADIGRRAPVAADAIDGARAGRREVPTIRIGNTADPASR